MENEGEYTDVLQNIESAIVSIYRTHPELTDHDVETALEALLRSYKGEERGKPSVLPRSPLSIQAYQSMRDICEFRLGRTDDKNTLKPDPISTEIILQALKRIRRSLGMWTKEGGRQGYLNYISQFM